MKLIKRIVKSNLSDRQGKYDLRYELWYTIRDIALPFRITLWDDVKSFSILCFHFERCKRYIPTDIGRDTTHVVTDTSKK